MKPPFSHFVVSICAAMTMLTPNLALSQEGRFGGGEVEVRGKELLLDGRHWVPHGFYQIAFEVAPANLGRALHPFWRKAQENYSPEEYTEMRKAGADTVRIQIAQAGADPRSPIFDRAFLEKALGAVRAARQAGLIVIVCVQDESHVKDVKNIDFPDEGTRRVWREIAPRFAHDRGVLFELLNEPRPKPNPPNWRIWKHTMMQTLRTVRETGARNVVIADGLDLGHTLEGAPLLDDSQVAYAAHPYAYIQYGQTRAAWDEKFGNFSRRAPVIITEWNFGSFFCNADTPEASVRFIQYLQEHEIGLAVGIWDWPPGISGSARWDFPHAKFSKFNGLSCHQPGYGVGRVIETWYKTGIPSNTPE